MIILYYKYNWYCMIDILIYNLYLKYFGKRKRITVMYTFYSGQTIIMFWIFCKAEHILTETTAHIPLSQTKLYSHCY